MIIGKITRRLIVVIFFIPIAFSIIPQVIFQIPIWVFTGEDLGNPWPQLILDFILDENSF